MWVDINSYTVFFHNTCIHSSNTIHTHNALLYWRLMEYSVFGIGIGRVHMHSKNTPPPPAPQFPADFWHADNIFCTAIILLFILNENKAYINQDKGDTGTKRKM
jgi:hypothetical protein